MLVHIIGCFAFNTATDNGIEWWSCATSAANALSISLPYIWIVQIQSGYRLALPHHRWKSGQQNASLLKFEFVAKKRKKDSLPRSTLVELRNSCSWYDKYETSTVADQHRWRYNVQRKIKWNYFFFMFNLSFRLNRSTGETPILMASLLKVLSMGRYSIKSRKKEPPPK